jgi:hypothetical protein
LPQASNSVAAHTAPLNSGAERPTKLARDLQSERLGARKYLTHPQSRASGEVSPSTVMIVQSTI